MSQLYPGLDLPFKREKRKEMGIEAGERGDHKGNGRNLQKLKRGLNFICDKE